MYSKRTGNRTRITRISLTIYLNNCNVSMHWGALYSVWNTYVKSNVKQGIATDNPIEVDGNFFTVQSENTLGGVIPEILKGLK